jgi:hypothetical protein
VFTSRPTSLLASIRASVSFFVVLILSSSKSTRLHGVIDQKTDQKTNFRAHKVLLILFQCSYIIYVNVMDEKEYVSCKAAAVTSQRNLVSPGVGNASLC